jgi:hypothetical protein
MPYDEFVKWQKYFEARPVGWRDDERTLKLLQVQGFKGEPASVFSSFAKMKKTAETVALKDSSVFGFLLNARGGDLITELIK